MKTNIYTKELGELPFLEDCSFAVICEESLLPTLSTVVPIRPAKRGRKANEKIDMPKANEYFTYKKVNKYTYICATIIKLIQVSTMRTKLIPSNHSLV